MITEENELKYLNEILTMCYIPAIHLYKVGCLWKKKWDLCVDLKTTIDELEWIG